MLRHHFELVSSDNHDLFSNMTTICLRILIIFLFVFFADKLTKEMENTIENFEEVSEIFESISSFGDQFRFISSMNRLRSRKYCIENIFFKIEWNIFVSVSQNLAVFLLLITFFTDFLNNIYLFDYHLSS